MQLRVEYYYDDEAHRWGFTIPALHIVGSAGTREQAEQQAIDAVLYALEGVDRDDDHGEDIQVEYLDVDVKPSRPVASAPRTRTGHA